MKKNLFLFCCCMMAYFAVFAQIVNIEDSRKKIDSTGFYGHIDVSLRIVKNSKRILTFRTSSRVDILQKRGAWLGVVNYRALQSQNTKLINDGFFHFRYGYFLNKKVTLEAFSQLQHNRQLRIGVRWLIGAGPRFLVFKQGKNSVYLGVLYMYEYDQLIASSIFFRDHRLSNYLSLHLQLAPNLKFASTSYYQPLIKDFSSSRFSSVNTLAFRLGRRINFRMQLSMSYDARLAKETVGVPALVYSFTNGLRWEF